LSSASLFPLDTCWVPAPFPEEEEAVLSPNARLIVSSALFLAADIYWY
jgi:hypothetical protein